VERLLVTISCIIILTCGSTQCNNFLEIVHSFEIVALNIFTFL